MNKASFRSTIFVFPTGEKRQRLSTTICRTIAGIPEFASARTIGLFSARTKEPDVSALWDMHRSAFPKVVRGQLSFYHVKQLTDLQLGYGGIHEPDSLSSRTAIFVGGDLILVPGCTFDLHGARIGSGKGFYDKFLATIAPGVTRVGVGWESQISSQKLPQDPHDICLQLLCTELGVRRCV